MMCKYVHATSGRAVQVPNRGSQKNFCELCNDLQRDSSKGGLLAYWLAPTASLCFQLALSAILCFQVPIFPSVTRSQSNGFRELATATLCFLLLPIYG